MLEYVCTRSVHVKWVTEQDVEDDVDAGEE
jgi:hypothetical protein